MNLIEVVVGLALLAGLLYWLRGYGPPVVRAYRQARELARVVRQARSAAAGPAPRDRRTMDVTARTAPSGPAALTALTVCPVCADRLTVAQMDALRARALRCPGSKRLSVGCPYRGERTLN